MTSTLESADGLGQLPEQVSGVELGDELEDACPGQFVAGNDRALNGRCAPPARKEREVQVDPAKPRRRKERFAHEAAECDDDAKVGGQFSDRVCCGAGQPVGFDDAKPELLCGVGDGGRCQDSASALR
jgi:hypothetical protein